MQTALTTVSKANLTPRAGVEALFRQKQLFLWVSFMVLLATGFVTLVKHRAVFVGNEISGPEQREAMSSLRRKKQRRQLS